MDKKQYSTPTAEMIDITTSQMLATSSIRVLSDDSGEEQMSGERRGTWGNFWTNEE